MARPSAPSAITSSTRPSSPRSRPRAATTTTRQARAKIPEGRARSRILVRRAAVPGKGTRRAPTAPARRAPPRAAPKAAGSDAASAKGPEAAARGKPGARPISRPASASAPAVRPAPEPKDSPGPRWQLGRPAAAQRRSCLRPLPLGGTPPPTTATPTARSWPPRSSSDAHAFMGSLSRRTSSPSWAPIRRPCSPASCPGRRRSKRRVHRAASLGAFVFAANVALIVLCAISIRFARAGDAAAAPAGALADAVRHLVVLRSVWCLVLIKLARQHPESRAPSTATKRSWTSKPGVGRVPRGAHLDRGAGRHADGPGRETMRCPPRSARPAHRGALDAVLGQQRAIADPVTALPRARPRPARGRARRRQDAARAQRGAGAGPRVHAASSSRPT